MTITEFAESRNVEAQAVSRFLSRHPEQKQNCRRVGKNLELSDEAFEFLSQQYPLPKPVMVVEGVPHEDYEKLQEKLSSVQEQLAKAKDIMLEMKDRISENEKQLIQKDADLKLLESKESLLNTALEDLKNEKSALQEENKELHSKIDSLNAELFEANRPKTLIEKLFGKKTVVKT